MTETIACSLDATEYRARLADMRELAGSALRSRAPIAGGHRLTFADDPQVRARLDRIVAAESSCCAFLGFDVRAAGGELLVDVTGPAEAEPIIAELFA